MNNQANSNNVAYLQSALRNLEERNKKLQSRVESLQNENERLVGSRTELMTEVERLQDQQIRLRERNLRLTQEFHSKQQECSLLAEKLTLFARGRVGLAKQSGPESLLPEVQEDFESSSDSLVTVELRGAGVSRPKILNVNNRTLSEPNLSVIQRELEMVRKGLWSPSLEGGKSAANMGELSAKIISSLKKGQSELEEQFTKMVEIQRNSLEAVQELSNILDDSPEEGHGAVFLDDTDPLTYVEQSTRSAVTLREKLLNQNNILRRLNQMLKAPPLVNEPSAASVVTQTSFNLHMPESITSSVWKNMQTDRICPLCENVFSTVISQEEFEDHVMEHFNSDEPILPDFEILAP